MGMNGSVGRPVKILLTVAPFDPMLFPDLMTKKLNEIAVKMDGGWKLFVITGYSTNQVKLRCQLEFRTAPIIGSPKSVLTRIIYLFGCILKGLELAKNEKVHIMTQHDGHLEYGMVAYIVSRLTHRKCLIRVNEDTLIPLIFFLKRSENYFFRSNITLKVVSIIYRKIEHMFFKHVDWIITHGPMDYQKIKEITDKITFVPLWVDTKKFKRTNKITVEKLRQKLGIADNVKVLLFVGRLHPEKDLETLLKALKIIKNKNILLLIIYSVAEYKDKYQILAKQLGVSDKVHFVGYIPHDDLPKWYSMADVYILPSIREEWSNTIMESMACETPVIATNVGGNRFQIREGKTGFLVPPRDPWTLAQKIQFVLENPDIARQVTKKALSEIKKYDKDSVGNLYINVIKNLIKSYERKDIRVSMQESLLPKFFATKTKH